jgi:bacteriorhodopsin
LSGLLNLLMSVLFLVAFAVMPDTGWSGWVRFGFFGSGCVGVFEGLVSIYRWFRPKQQTQPDE